MRFYFSLIFSAYGVCSLASPSLVQVEVLVKSGLYDKASKIVEEIDVSNLTSDESLRYVLLRAKISYVFSRNDELSHWFQELFYRQPNYTFDAAAEPPSFIEAWERVKSQSKVPLNREPTHELPNRPFGYYLAPFGIGHFNQGQTSDGLYYMSYEILTLALPPLLRSPLVVPEYFRLEGSQRLNLALTSIIGFLGVWSYEVAAVMGELDQSYSSQVRRTRQVLNWAPLGVGQAVNGEAKKAFWFGSVQLSFLALSFMAKDTGIQNIGIGGFIGAYTFGVIDSISTTPVSSSSGSVTIRPTAYPGPGLMLSVLL